MKIRFRQAIFRTFCTIHTYDIGKSSIYTLFRRKTLYFSIFHSPNNTIPSLLVIFHNSHSQCHYTSWQVSLVEQSDFLNRLKKNNIFVQIVFETNHPTLRLIHSTIRLMPPIVSTPTEVYSDSKIFFPLLFTYFHFTNSCGQYDSSFTKSR